MKKYLLGLTAAIALFAGCALPTGTQASKATGPAEQAAMKVVPITTEAKLDELVADGYVNEGYVIVKTVDGFDESAFEALGADVAGSFTLRNASGTYWRLYKGAKVVKLINALRFTKGVLWAEPELLSELPPYETGSAADESATARAVSYAGAIDDPVSLSSEYSLAITDALDAYREHGVGGNTVYVGIIDTGINMAHEDFYSDGASIVQYAKSAFTKAADGTMTYVGSGTAFVDVPAGENWDDKAHGTHVAGTIAAVGNNQKGVAGVAWDNVKLISYKCFSLADSGSGSDWAVYHGLADLADWKADAANGVTQETIPVNMSLGGGFAGSFELEMINYAIDNGVLPIVAMGNEGTRLAQYPASYTGVVAVGATNGKDKKVSFSNSGAWISVSAPGYDIVSTGNGDALWNTDSVVRQTEYQWMSGTSMACPFVTGLVAYMLTFDPSLTAGEIKTILEATTDDLGGAGFDEDYGYGRVNVAKAADIVDGGVIPASSYSTGTITATVDNVVAGYDSGLGTVGGVDCSNRVIGQAVYLYDADGDFVSLAVTNSTNGEAQFKLLRAGTYTVRTSYFDDNTSASAVLGASGDVSAALQVSKYVIYISTVANGAYAAAGTDTVLSLYRDEAMTDAVLDGYDSTTLDTAAVELVSGTTYWVKVSSYEDDYTATNANYALQVSTAPLLSASVADGTRLATEDDSHEADDTGAEATAKGALAVDTPFGANLLDVDVFMFTAP